MQKFWANQILCLSPQKKIPNAFYYKFVFLSLISPWMLNNVRLFLTTSLFFSSTYLYLKQSYLLLTWLYYLTFAKRFSTRAVKQKSTLYCRFFVAPVKRQVFTLLKAPMAHKTYSKEQFTILHYNIHFWFSYSLIVSLRQVNSALLFILLTKTQFPSFESNLFFLKYFYLRCNYADVDFFNYFVYK